MKNISIWNILFLLATLIFFNIGFLNTKTGIALTNNNAKISSAPKNAIKITLPKEISIDNFQTGTLADSDKNKIKDLIKKEENEFAERQLIYAMGQKKLSDIEKNKILNEIDVIIYFYDSEDNLLSFRSQDINNSITLDDPSQNNLTLDFVPSAFATNFGMIAMPANLQTIINDAFNAGYPILKEYLFAPYKNQAINIVCASEPTAKPQYMPNADFPYISLGRCTDPETGDIWDNWQNDNYYYPKRAFLHEIVHAFENTAIFYETAEGIARIMDGEITKLLGYNSQFNFAPTHGLTGMVDYDREQRLEYYDTYQYPHNMGVDFWWSLFNEDREIFKKFHESWYPYCRNTSYECFSEEEPNSTLNTINILRDIAPAQINGQSFSDYVNSVPLNDFAIGLSDNTYAPWYKEFTIGLTSFPNTSVTASFYPYGKSNTSQVDYWQQNPKFIQIKAYGVDNNLLAETNKTQIDKYSMIFYYNDFGNQLSNYQGRVKFDAVVTDEKGNSWQAETFGISHDQINENVGITGFITDTNEKEGTLTVETVIDQVSQTVPVNNNAFVVPNSWNNLSGRLKITYLSSSGNISKEKYIFKSDHHFINGIRGSFNLIWIKGTNDETPPSLSDIKIKQIPLPNCISPNHNFELFAKTNEKVIAWIEPLADSGTYKSYFSVSNTDLKTVLMSPVVDEKNQNFKIVAVDKFSNVTVINNVSIDNTSVTVEKIVDYKNAKSGDTVKYSIIPHFSCAVIANSNNTILNDIVSPLLEAPKYISERGKYNQESGTVSWPFYKNQLNNTLPFTFEAKIK